MSREERIAAARAEDQIIAEIVGGPGKWWYLSFCDPDRPTGQQFLGGCYVQAHTLAGAISAAWTHGCNPGGEVAAVEIPDELWSEHSLAAKDCHRLLTAAEVKAL